MYLYKNIKKESLGWKKEYKKWNIFFLLQRRIEKSILNSFFVYSLDIKAYKEWIGMLFSNPICLAQVIRLWAFIFKPRGVHLTESIENSLSNIIEL